MTRHSFRSRLLGCCAAALPLAAESALAQETLPEIEIAAASPIARRAPAQKNKDAGPGVLKIVTDQFATTTVVGIDEIRRSPGATLGDVLNGKPGISSSSFAPGANRPILRGLDNYRVRVQENGIGASGVSELGEDHGVPLDPLAIGRVEVVRGPATLRWGSQAIGGVIDASNDRIPTALPCREGQTSLLAPCMRAETRSAVSTVDAGLEQAALVDVGQGNFAFHADAHGRRTSNYAIPAYPYLSPPETGAPGVGGRQPNSWLRSSGWSAGGSYIFDRGFFGVAVTRFESVYRIPGVEASDTRTRIDMRQTKVTGRGEYRPLSSFVDAIRLYAGVTDYQHHELGDEGGFDGIQQTFANQEQEGRIEAQLKPFELGFGRLVNAVGVQGSHQRLIAPGVDGALFDPTESRSIAFYSFNELALSTATRLQLAGRIEQVETSGKTPNLFVDPSLSIGYQRNFAPKSLSFGLLHDLPFALTASLTASHVERAPRGPELFSHGVHDATGTFDIGNPNLSIESAQTVEAGLRRAEGPLRFEATVFYTHFNGFIYRRLTGESCDGDIESCTPSGAGGDVHQAVYSQRDANFVGGEFQSQWDAAALMGGVFGVENQLDVVRATFTDGTNVPRIPPVRVGGGIFWRDSSWLARINVLHAFAQNHVAPIAETPTKDYNRLRAEISYRAELPASGFPAREIRVGVIGDNLLNADIRNSVSYKKDEVPMAGANARLFVDFVF
ncbi:MULTISPECIES: TonB-dependent receptor [Methylosinus]|uniref:TonB-dependent receptor n=1 Tax=Methylosinus trichosporium (strain ATCC 35070 / NCIMB 11131 / UNIQEM 75 / OB3b) TaxID=595536 RepID=A0A2D2CXW2_METT3|nr:MULTISPECIES: TonB-dependent receptor [Methylosinus]ATQ67544.1 TonB-dependent receptor [Methylosinus trichosporium OB3b]OBS50826.1 TonB-dependent receptor [Methylosinus sp. 3S-1]